MVGRVAGYWFDPMRRLSALGLSVVLLSFSGCGEGKPRFEANNVFRLRVEAETGREQQDAQKQVIDLMESWFGSPDEPKWPEVGASDDVVLINAENLVRAAGAVRSERDDKHYGLFREHCSNCHGLTGDGRGPTALFLAPYPRDFRPGWFKYKSTKRGSKPTRDDLVRVVQHGIPGTSMPSFGLIEEGDLQAIIDYVIYLSIRGELERDLLYEAAQDDELISSSVKSSDGESLLEAKAKELLAEIKSQWSTASQAEVQASVPALAEGSLERLAAIDRGRNLFLGSVAACANCHGKTGAGNGQVRDYDDWTKDGTVRAGIEPSDRAGLKDYFAAGGLKPVPISPRDLRSGVYRGGSRPEDIYRRIVQGIEGTPMPAVAMKPDNPQGLTEQEVWDLVFYVLEMPREVGSTKSAEPATAGASNVASASVEETLQ